MVPRTASYLLVAALVGGGAFALFRPSSAPAETTEEERPRRSPPSAPPEATDDPLPPDHPPIGNAGPSQGSAQQVPSPGADTGPLHWKVPDAWHPVPSPSPMRLATYRLPLAPGDADGAEMSVARAGGSKEANIQRWIGQFEDAGKDVREERTVHGITVTIVTVSGTYLAGGMMPGANATQHPKWSLLAAIVDTPGTPYFFKLTGPQATIKAARSGFDAMIASLTAT